MPRKSPLKLFLPNYQSKIRIPYIPDGVAAGFPSPASDFMEDGIDLNTQLSDNPLATFYIKVRGNSMVDAGIEDQDVLVVDRSIEPQNNKIAICCVDGEFTVKRIQLSKDCLYLMPENPSFDPIKITEDNQFIIWGIVTYVIKKV